MKPHIGSEVNLLGSYLPWLTIQTCYYISRTEALRTNRHDSNDRLPLVVTYNPSLPHISNILHKHFHILLSSKRCRDVFRHPPIVAYRRTSNLRVILVKVKLPTITTPNNTFYHRDHSAVDKIVLLVLTLLTVLHYTFFSTGATRQIKSHITCNTKNLHDTV